MANTVELRYWAKVDKTTTPDGCWNWLAAIDSTGYGAFGWYGKKRNSHRISYEIANGPIARNMDIRHTCDNRLCCNPKHLIPGSRLQNVHDSIERMRHAEGENVGTAKLNEPLVKAIKMLADLGMSESKIYHQLGLGRRCVRDILNGVTWKHISD